MSNPKFLFTRKSGQRLKFTTEEMAEAWDIAKQYGADASVHPDVREFASSWWVEQTHVLSFETPGRSWDQCSREIARRHPWVYLARGRVPENSRDSYVIDVQEVE